MKDWISTALHLIAHNGAVVLVTVARAEGSTPREAGAKMLVAATEQRLTIGGGHLEWRAADIARNMLQVGNTACGVERMALGPSLGQCCGGVATLAFELLTASDITWLQALQQTLQAGRACLRTRTLRGANNGHAGPVSVTTLGPDDAWPSTGRHQRCVLTDMGGRLSMTELLAPPEMHVVLFGAGHVGQAIVRVLATLPCTVTWVDERDAQFPGNVPESVTIEATDTPEAVIDQAPAGSFFLVMTHCHALDQRLCQQIFRRDDFAYFGLIGSRSKRRKFERRLTERGVPPERLAQMTCPVGIEGILGKAPEIIAIAVVAQLLQTQALRARGEGNAAHLPMNMPMYISEESL
ncbi:xanthine dehydrogenase accessory protein XdhC [Pusillimonas sp. ANT_WB101]|uniref:xanthine dehydrogenase accessory protein XdhC n=1 Tax=Pusillimonas sp. ANT_WB101 TaxID=2597356 RepID=UPI0011EE2AEC|nr:xanthine dehydrogenase accessory protein XdhC [Pusillimonas sp. ANT_WB101]KAA0891129.1 xanthine dehydrogenase accessory protein XdhC [Pusillimonas sp. ANT_WB101]